MTPADEESVDDNGVLMDFTSSFKNTAAESSRAPGAAAGKPWLRRKKRTGSAATASSGEGSHDAETFDVAATKNSRPAAAQRAKGWFRSASNSMSSTPSPTKTRKPASARANTPSAGKENLEDESSDVPGLVDSPMPALGNRQVAAAPSTAHEDSDVMGGLNAKLDALGFPQLQVSDPSSIVQVVQTILEELRHASDMTQSYESTSHEAQIDCSRLQNEKEALKLQVLCARQDLAALENRARIAADQHAKEKQRSDAWNKELQVTIAKMEGQQKGWQAALNRKEAEYDRLQTRMQMLQTHRDRAVKRALEMDTPPVKGGTRPMLGSPESWEATTSPSAGSNANANNEEASQAEIEAAAAQSLAVLEEAAETSRGRRVAYLVNENQKLRASLHSMQNLIVTKLQAAASIQLGRKAAKTPRADAGSKDAALSTANPALVEIDTLRLADSSFDLPAEQLERRLTDVQNQTLAFLEAQEAQAQANDASGEDHPPTEAELKERLDQAKTLIHDLDACLRATLLFQTEDSDPEMQHHRGARAGAGAAADGLDDEVAALRAKQYFEQEEADLRRARERLEQDRAMLHEEARKIDEERSKLDRKLFAQNAGIAQTPNATKLMHTPSLVERLSTPDPHADASARKTLRFAELGVAPTPATRRLLDEIL